MFFRKKSYKTIQAALIAELGINDVAIYYCFLLSRKISMDVKLGLKERIQFIREELDAASQGNEYSQNFADYLEPNKAWYRGAICENSKLNIDREGGPQDTLLKIIIPLMKDDVDTAVKLRCAIVKYTFDDMVYLSQFTNDINCMFDVSKYMETYAKDYKEVRARISEIDKKIDIIVNNLKKY